MNLSYLVVIGGILGAFGFSAQAGEDALPGRQVFLEACAGCHGSEALGDGPTASLLSVEVPDLTRFAARNDGEFDAVLMVQIVDGREGLAAHGGPMPMFGGLLTGPSVLLDGPAGDPVSTSEPILRVVQWLETVQQE